MAFELAVEIDSPVEGAARRRLLSVHAAVSESPPVRDRLTIAQDGPGWMSLEPRVAATLLVG